MDLQTLMSSEMNNYDSKRNSKNFPNLLSSEDQSGKFELKLARSPNFEKADRVINPAHIRFKTNTKKEKANVPKRKSALPRTITSIKHHKEKVGKRKSSVDLNSITVEPKAPAHKCQSKNGTSFRLVSKLL